MAGWDSERRRSTLAEEVARRFDDRDPDTEELAQALARLPAAERPSAEEVRQRLLVRRRLFGGAAQLATLRAKREAALAAMELFAEFSPRLVGPVWEGSANAHSALTLHLYADRPESVSLCLDGHRIPHREGETHLKFGRGDWRVLPCLRFVAGSDEVRLVVLPQDHRQPPLDPENDRPMARGRIEGLKRRIAESE